MTGGRPLAWFLLPRKRSSPFIAHGSRPAAGASARAPHARRAAVAACREPNRVGLAPVVACIVGALVLALAAGAALGASIPLGVRGIALNAADSSVNRVGRLHYLGGLALRSEADAFGGLSGLSVTADGRLAAVTDRGHRFTARIVRDAAGRLVDLVEGSLAPLADTQGRPLAGHWRDAEALERLPGGDWLVSFERNHRVWRYAAGSGGPDGPARPFPTPDPLANAPLNGGLEALAPLPDGRVLMLAEDLRRPDGAHAGWLVGDGTRPFGYRPAPDFKPTDAALLPGGDLLVLTRYFSLIGGLKARLERVPAGALAADAVVRGVLVAHIAPPLTVDNFEGVAVARDADGGTLVYLLSDDNFNAFQRTLLLLFRLDAE